MQSANKLKRERVTYFPIGYIAAAHKRYYPRSPRHAGAIAHTEHTLALFHAHMVQRQNDKVFITKALERVDDLLARRELQLVALAVYDYDKAQAHTNETSVVEAMFTPFRDRLKMYG